MGNSDLIKRYGRLWVVLLTLSGIIIFFIGKYWAMELNPVFGEILEYVGMAIFSVFGVSLIYERYMAKYYFDHFNDQLRSELKNMESIQSKCISLGISEVFGSTDAYKQKYPLMSIVDKSTGTITCVGLTLFNLLNMTNEIRKGLEKGLNFNFAYIDPKVISNEYKFVANFDASDIEVVIDTFKRDFLEWAKEKKTLELKQHCISFFDSGLIFNYDNEEKLVWSLSFGRDLSHRMIIILDTRQELGRKLKQRYMSIYDKAELKVKYSDGQIQGDVSFPVVDEGK